MNSKAGGGWNRAGEGGGASFGGSLGVKRGVGGSTVLKEGGKGRYISTMKQNTVGSTMNTNAKRDMVKG